MYPIKEVIGEFSHENAYPAVLRETKEKWQEDWESIRAKRRKAEFLASQKKGIMVILDTSIIIDHLRQAHKRDTLLLKIAQTISKENLALSVISP